MPPVPRPRRAQPQSARCRFVDDDGVRYRRVATIGGELCRRCAIRLEMELAAGSTADRVVSSIDREVSRRGTTWGAIWAGAVNGILGDLLRQRGSGPPPPPGSSSRSRSQPSPRSSPPPPRPPRPPPDPSLRARQILGFEPTEILTKEAIQKRRQALARVFHPDMQGGSLAQMTRINQAADLLLAKLS